MFNPYLPDALEKKRGLSVPAAHPAGGFSDIR
jgi:hypothetical protein